VARTVHRQVAGQSTQVPAPAAHGVAASHPANVSEQI